MLQTSQGGSILGFILGGTLLAVILLGGILFLHQKKEQAPIPPVQPEQQREKPRSEEKESRQPAPSTAPEDRKETPQSSAPSPSVPSHTSDMPRLPETGPGETLASVFILMLLSYVAISYAQSRKATSL